MDISTIRNILNSKIISTCKVPKHMVHESNITNKYEYNCKCMKKVSDFKNLHAVLGIIMDTCPSYHPPPSKWLLLYSDSSKGP